MLPVDHPERGDLSTDGRSALPSSASNVVASGPPLGSVLPSFEPYASDGPRNQVVGAPTGKESRGLRCGSAEDQKHHYALPNRVGFGISVRMGGMLPWTYSPFMIDLEDNDVISFVDLAFDRMMRRAVALGPRVSDRPYLEGSNSVYSLVTHCVGVTEWWFGHVVLGRASQRDRDAEFDATGTVSELQTMVNQFRSSLPELVRQVARTAQPESGHLDSLTAEDRAWPWTTASVVLHVIEELFQHAGHVDITADLLASQA